MGARPKPTALKVIAGTDQPCRVRDDEPKPKVTGLRRPDTLRRDAGRYWNDLKKRLLECKVLTNIDAHALAILCNHMAELHDAQEKLQEVGLVIRGRHGTPVVNPYLRIVNQKSEMIRKMLIEFGMTPSARTRVGTGEKGEGGANEFDF